MTENAAHLERAKELIREVTGCPDITAGEKSLAGLLAAALAACARESEKPYRELLATWRKYIRREMNNEESIPIGDELVYCDAMRHCADELAAASERAVGEKG